MATRKQDDRIIAFRTDVTFAAKEDGTPPTFEMTAYTGSAIELSNFDLPVVVDLEGAKFHKSIKANLNHDRKQIVGHVSGTHNDGQQVRMSGTISGGGPAAMEVLNAHKNGYPWEASIQANRLKVEVLAKGKNATINGRKFTGPMYVARESNIYAVAFCDQGADENTTVTIAASAASTKGTAMKAEVAEWVKKMLPSVDIEALSADEVANLEANYEGRETPRPKRGNVKFGDGIEAKKMEAERQDGITEIALAACDKRPYDIENIQKLGQQAIDEKWSVEKFRLELLEASLPPAHTVFRTKRDDRLSNDVIQAAICVAGRLNGHEEMFSDQVLQAAHDRFKNGIGLKQLFLLAAESNGYHASYANDINLDVQRAAFGMRGPEIKAQGWSTIDISTILANTANKFLREGWMAVDMTPMAIASVRSVRDFKTITTISLTGALQFEKVGTGGEIKHGELGETTYTGKAETYGIMLALTRQDLINDDLGALTAVPRRIGRGGALKLNDVFWTVFLNNTGSFFVTANANINEGVADMTIGGLTATETIFMNQTDPDGKPLGLMPSILLVPTALKAAALNLMNSERLIDGTATAKQGDANVYRGRFRVESSPYMSNSSYSGYSAIVWYMLASPSEMPVVEIQALNGRVEPTVDTADAEFNVLGVQMRGYSDIGVSLQEPRGGVRSDGGSS